MIIVYFFFLCMLINLLTNAYTLDAAMKFISEYKEDKKEKVEDGDDSRRLIQILKYQFLKMALPNP